MTQSEPDSRVENPQPRRLREILSTELFQGEKMIVINHSGEQYRLSITRNDKLILQK